MNSPGAVARRARALVNLSGVGENAEDLEGAGGRSPPGDAPSVGSNGSSRRSKGSATSSRRKESRKSEVNLKADKKLGDLDNEEERFHYLTEVAKYELERINRELTEKEEQLEGLAGQDMDEDRKRLEKEIQNLQDKRKREELNIMHLNLARKSVARKKEFVNRERDDELQKIDDDDDSNLGSENEDSVSVRDEEMTADKVTRQAEVQKAILQQRKMREEYLKCQIEKATEASRMAQEKADREIAEALQEKMKLEDELCSLHSDNSPASPTTAVGKLNYTDVRLQVLPTRKLNESEIPGDVMTPSRSSVVRREAKDDFFESTKPEVSVMEQLAKACTKIAEIVTLSAPSTNPIQTTHFLARQSYGKDLPKFDGSPEAWPTFRETFRRTTENCGFTNSDNITRLEKSLVGEARTYVCSLLISPDNVPTIMRKLEVRFGQPEAIIEAMIEKARGIQKFRGTDLDSFISFGAAVQNATATIQSLNRPEHLNNPQLLRELEDKLPELHLMHWLNYVGVNKIRNLINFNEWIDLQTELVCAARPPKIKPKETPPSNIKKEFRQPDRNRRVNFADDDNKRRTDDIPTAAGLFAGHKESLTRMVCVFCGKHKDSSTCAHAPRIPLEEKIKILKQNKICSICLLSQHWEQNCRAFVSCCICSRKHLAMMCPDNPNHRIMSTPPSSSSYCPRSGSPPPPDAVLVKQNLVSSTSTQLQTLSVTISGPKNKRGRRVRVLLDSGSERSYILKSLVEELGLQPNGKEQLIHELFGGFQTEAKPHNSYLVTLDSPHKTVHSFEALDADRIVGKLQRLAPGGWLKELRQLNIFVSDVGKDSPSVEILLGSDATSHFYTGRVYELTNGLTALETVLGWTVFGRQKEPVVRRSLVTRSLSVIDHPIQNFWDLEAIGISDPSEQRTRKENEALAKEHFLKTVTRDPDGRYVVSLPWIDGRPNIPNNRKIAERRLMSTTKSLLANGMFENYDKLFKSWEEEGFIVEVKDDDINKPCHYLPHHGVFKPDSLTTPIRPVFDPTTKAPRTPSLNECMEKGPHQTELLLSVLLRLREKPIGVISDIRKAFQMIRVDEEDQDFLRFLWWEDHTLKTIKVYKHQRVVFGINNSPFILSAVLEEHLSKVKPEEQAMAQKLLKSLYVDNNVSSEDTEEDVVTYKNWSTAVLEDAKMELRGWECGFAEESRVGPLISRGCGLDTGRPSSQIENAKRVTSVLGYRWDKVEDVLFCDLKLEKIPEKVTKRTILSNLQKVFDPLGFTCPVTIVPKMWMQELWKEKVSWDKALGDSVRVQFLSWLSELELLSQVKIPRHMRGGISGRRQNNQLHTFSDGSKKAYSGVVFLRTEDDEGGVSVQLLLAKTRVAPLKNTTINRLELMGCYIAAALTDTVKEALSMEDIRTTYWSDSSTALSWIKGNDLWGTFVGNRVKTICSLSNPDSWRYVPGPLNPADLPSRGCSPRQLLKSEWFQGPEWLRRPKNEWPSQDITPDAQEVMAERRTSKVLTTQISEPIESPWYVKRSSYSSNVRVMAFVMRFMKNCKRGENGIENKKEKEKRHRFLIIERQNKRLDQEVKRAAVVVGLYEKELNGPGLSKTIKARYKAQLWRYQRIADEKAAERVSMRTTSTIFNTNLDVQLEVKEVEEAENMILRILQQDTLPLDQSNVAGLLVCKLKPDDGLVHVRTKLTNRQDHEGFKYPVLLPNNHPLVDQIVREKHEGLKHAGAQVLMGEIREKFWIIQGRRVIRKLLGKCVTCRRYTAKKTEASPAALPEDRIKDAKPFEVTGVDLAGPLFTTDKKKSWIVLFTCAVYRCVHLEVVHSLSTEAFLDALTRFISRRGRPTTIYSDNGTNFLGADKAMRKLDWARITKEFGMQRIQWRFNPPAAPWWGGWWERLVRSVKDLLRRTLKNAKVNSDALSTLLCEIEATINSRPLTFVTEDPEDFRPLTPAMFLQDLQCPRESDQSLIYAGGLQQQYKRRVTTIREIKMRFRREYLALLVHRGKKEKGERELEIGEVVLVGADNKKRWEWPMGRILELLPGKDGKSRVVIVRTASGIFKRPVQHIFPMEVFSGVPVPDQLQAPLKISPEQITREVIEDPSKPNVYTRVGRKVNAPDRLDL